MQASTEGPSGSSRWVKALAGGAFAALAISGVLVSWAFALTTVSRADFRTTVLATIGAALSIDESLQRGIDSSVSRIASDPVGTNDRAIARLRDQAAALRSLVAFVQESDPS